MRLHKESLRGYYRAEDGVQALCVHLFAYFKSREDGQLRVIEHCWAAVSFELQRARWTVNGFAFLNVGE